MDVSIDHTFQLINRMKHTEVKRGKILGSFDIVNMYPNVPNVPFLANIFFIGLEEKLDVSIYFLNYLMKSI